MAQSQRILIALFALVAATAAFTQPSSSIGVSRYAPVAPVKPAAFSNSNVFENNAVGESKTMLMERRWNFNEARGPFGMKKNAEIWNGRVAQMGFTIVLLQELVTGKGAIQSFQDGDLFSYFLVGLGGITVLGLSVFLAFKGKEKDIVF